jgi:hypothetical protein
MENRKIVLSILCHFILTAIFFAQTPDTTWTKRFNSVENPNGSIDGASSVQQTADSGYILAGYYCATGSGLWLIKTDENGDTTWTKVYRWEPQDDHIGYCVQQNIDGGYIIAGYIMVYDHNYNKSLLLKTNAYGDTIWSQIQGDSLNGRRNYAVQQTADSGYIVIGYVRSTSTNNSRIHLQKLDNNGGTLWSKLYGDDILTAGYSVQQTSDNGYILTGNISGALWLAKTNADGDTVWTKSYGNGAVGFSVKQLSNGGYIVGGIGGSASGGWLLRTNTDGDTLWTKTYGNMINSVDIVSESGFILGGLSGGDFYIARTDINGNLLWTKTFNGTGSYYDDECMSISRTSDNGYIAAGLLSTTGNSGYTDVYLVKIETDTLAIMEQSECIARKQINSTIISGPLLLPEVENCKIFDITGRGIHTINPAPGIYFIEMDGMIKQRIIKVR